MHNKRSASVVVILDISVVELTVELCLLLVERLGRRPVITLTLTLPAAADVRTSVT